MSGRPSRSQSTIAGEACTPPAPVYRSRTNPPSCARRTRTQPSGVPVTTQGVPVPTSITAGAA